MNGWFTWWTTWALLAGGVLLGLYRPSVLAQQLGPLFSTVNLLVYPLALFLYFHGKEQIPIRAAPSSRVTRSTTTAWEPA